MNIILRAAYLIAAIACAATSPAFAHTLSTPAGNGSVGFRGDGGQATSAMFGQAIGILSSASALPTMSINDVSITEGNSGSKAAVFTVRLSSPAASNVTFDVATSEGNAVGNDDFQHYYSYGRTIFAGETSATLELVIFGDSVIEPDETFQVTLSNVTNATLVDGVATGTMVNDDTGASPSLLIGDVSISEGNSGTKTANFTVQLSKAAASAVSFNIATANGSAASGSDYTALSLSNQSIPAGQLYKSFSVTINGDTTAEADETFTVNLSNATGAGIGRGQAVGSIANDDNVSSVKISVGDMYIQEGDSGPRTATFTVQLSRAATSTVSFDIKTEDSSATAGTDYVAKALTGQSIATGQTSKTFTVTVNGDTTPESEERFIVTLSNIVGAAIEYADAHGVCTIPNDDASMSIGDVSMLEGSSGTGNAMRFPVTLSTPLAGSILFQVQTIDGTANSSDYNGQSGSNWQIPAGATSVDVIIWVQPDTDLEADETFKVRISGGEVPILDNEAVGTILNDDLGPPTITLANGSVAEGDSDIRILSFPLRLSHAAPNSVTINFRTASCSGTATADVDYTPTVGGSIYIPAGVVDLALEVVVRGDTAVEPDEQFCMVLDSADGAVIGNSSATGTIVNDDGSASQPWLYVGDVSIVEGNSGTKTATFTVSLSGPAATDVTFNVATTNGSAAALADYVAFASQGMVIPAGSTSKTFGVTINGDTVPEMEESFTVNVSGVTGAAILADGQAIGTISNDDGPILPMLSISDGSIVEGNSGLAFAEFLVSLAAPATNDVTFNVTTSDGSATVAGSDYIAQNGGGVFHVGDMATIVQVPVNGDTAVEPDETFTVNLSNVVGATVTDGSAIGTITNDDGPSLSIADVAVTEGNSGTALATFTVKLSKVSTTAVTYNIATANGTATAGSDYVASTLTGQSIPAGQTSKTFSVRINGDTAVEGNEAFAVNVSNVAGATVADGSAAGMVINDDVYSLSIGDVVVTEGNSGTKLATFTVKLSDASATPVTFNAATANGSATTAGGDYVALPLTGLSIPAGQTTKTVTVTINGDPTVEGNETLVLNLSSPVGATISDSQAIGYIVNDDGPTLSIADAALSEGNSGTKLMTFTVKLSQPAPGTVTYNLATANGNATGTDFVAVPLTAQSIPAGQTSKTVTVTINGDSAVEANETFGVYLSSPVGATLSDSQGIGTILNDDGPTLSVADVAVSEGNSGTKLMTFTVKLTPAASVPVTYSIDTGTGNGSATVGSDYVASSLGNQTILAGQTNKTFAVTINGDTAVEGNETFGVKLGSVTGATVLDGNAIGYILNDDGPTLSVGDVSISEGNSGTKLATFTLTLSQVSASPVTYTIATANGTATAGSDYVASTLTGQSIPAGQTSKTFAVTINGDTAVEPNETFAVNLSAVVGATIADSLAVGTISNDDGAALRVARVATGGLYDDIDDGNGAPLLSLDDYVLLLQDAAQQICRRAGTATIVAVDGVESRAVLDDLADATNTTCNTKPHYAAVMVHGDSRGFLIEVPKTPNARGLQVLGPPEMFTDADSTALTVLGVGQTRPITVLLASAAEGTPPVRRAHAQALVQRVQQRFAQDANANVIVLGANAVKGLVDLTVRAQPPANLRGTAWPNDRILVSPGLLRQFRRADAEFLLLPTKDEPAQYLQLQQ